MAFLRPALVGWVHVRDRVVHSIEGASQGQELSLLPMKTELGHAIGMQDGPGYFLTPPVMATQLDHRVVNQIRKRFRSMHCMCGK